MLGAFKDTLKDSRRIGLQLFSNTIRVSHEVLKGKTLVIAPHPDDEVFGLGGTIAMKRRAGIDVHVVFLTDGEAALSHQSKTPAAEIGLQRRGLASKSTGILDVPESCLHWMGLPDGQLKDLGKKEFDFAAAQIVNLINLFEIEEVYAPHPMEYLPDHVIASQIVRTAVFNSEFPPALWFYLVWALRNMPLRKMPLLGWKYSQKLVIEPVKAQKKNAMQTYLDALDSASNLPFCGELPTGLLKAFQWSYELTFSAYSRRASQN